MKKSPYQDWTLFLDRDGVINERIPGAYVTRWEDFRFTEDAVESIVQFKNIFKRIVVVTNQQGIGKGIFTKAALDAVHDKMMLTIIKAGGHIDQVYYCPELAKHNPLCRKPNPGMGYQAQRDFPDIDFSQSLMVGDSISDIEFGKALGMHTVLIEGKTEEAEKSALLEVDFRCENLRALAIWLKKT